MPTCLPEKLIAQAKGYDYLSEAQLAAVKTNLLCNINNNPTELATLQAAAAEDLEGE